MQRHRKSLAPAGSCSALSEAAPDTAFVPNQLPDPRPDHCRAYRYVNINTRRVFVSPTLLVSTYLPLSVARQERAILRLYLVSLKIR
jgi:hypothetical protein